MKDQHRPTPKFVLFILLSLLSMIPITSGIVTVEVSDAETGTASDIYINTIFANVSELDTFDSLQYWNDSYTLTNLYWADTTNHSKSVTLKIGGSTVGTGTMTIDHDTGWWWKLELATWDRGVNTGVKQIDLTYSPLAQNLRVDPEGATCSGAHCVDKVTTAVYPYDGPVAGYISSGTLYVHRGTYQTAGGDYGGIYDTNLSATGLFCAYNEIDFNLSVTPSSSGYFEIYIYKDSLSYQYAGDTGTDTDYFLYSKTLPAGDYYTQSFFTPDGEETSYGEWLNFTMMSGEECLIAPNGTIYSNLTYSWLDILTPWDYNWSSIMPFNYTGPTTLNDTFVYHLYEMGLISEDEFTNISEVWNEYNNDTQTNIEIQLQENMTLFSRDIIGMLTNGTNSTRANMNTSHGILSNYTAPITTIGGYALSFVPDQIIDLITALLVIDLGFLILWARK